MNGLAFFTHTSLGGVLVETGLTGEFRTAHASILSCPQERERIVGKSFPAPGNALLGHPRSYCSKFPTIPPAGHPDNVAADEAFYKIYMSRPGRGGETVTGTKAPPYQILSPP